jgi:hypothetical protein
LGVIWELPGLTIYKYSPWGAFGDAPVFRLGLDGARWVHGPFAPALSAMPGQLPEKVPHPAAPKFGVHLHFTHIGPKTSKRSRAVRLAPNGKKRTWRTARDFLPERRKTASGKYRDVCRQAGTVLTALQLSQKSPLRPEKKSFCRKAHVLPRIGRRAESVIFLQRSSLPARFPTQSWGVRAFALKLLDRFPKPQKSLALSCG